MPNVRALNQKKYHVSKHRFFEVYHFCLQYNEWREELLALTDTVGSIDTTKDYVQGTGGDPTAKLAMRRTELSKNCEMIERAAAEADPELYKWIIMAVTNEGTTYQDLEGKGIPCGRDRFYDRRRKFYWILSNMEI